MKINLQEYIKENQLILRKNINNTALLDNFLLDNMNLYLKKINLYENKNIVLKNNYDIIEFNGQTFKSFLIINETNNINIRFNWSKTTLKSINISNELFENKNNINSLITIYLDKNIYESSGILFNIIEKLFNKINIKENITEEYILSIINEDNIKLNFLDTSKEIIKNLRKINTFIKDNLDDKYFTENFNKNINNLDKKKHIINVSINKTINKIITI